MCSEAPQTLKGVSSKGLGCYTSFESSNTFAGKSNWAVQGALKGFYVNCEVTLKTI